MSKKEMNDHFVLVIQSEGKQGEKKACFEQANNQSGQSFQAKSSEFETIVVTPRGLR